MKILIFYACYGGGHFNAAKSIADCLEKYYDDIDLELIDCMKYVNKTIEKVTTTAYNEMAKKLHGLGEKFILTHKKDLLHIFLVDQIKLWLLNFYVYYVKNNLI